MNSDDFHSRARLYEKYVFLNRSVHEVKKKKQDPMFFNEYILKKSLNF